MNFFSAKVKLKIEMFMLNQQTTYLNGEKLNVDVDFYQAWNQWQIFVIQKFFFPLMQYRIEWLILFDFFIFNTRKT